MAISTYTSLPSKATTVANIPETQFIVENCIFTYNYWTADETTSRSSVTFSQNDVTATWVTLHTGMTDEEVLRAMARSVPPRTITLNWHQVELDESLLSDGVPIPISMTSFGSQNILYAEALSNLYYSGINLQDMHPEENFYDFIADTMAVIGSSVNFSTSGLDRDIMAAAQSLDTSKLFEAATPSSLDTILELLDGSTSISTETGKVYSQMGSTTRRLLARVLSNYQSMGWGFSSSDGVLYAPGAISTSVLSNSLDPVKFVTFDTSVLNTVLFDMFWASIQSASGAFDDEYLMYPTDKPLLKPGPSPSPGLFWEIQDTARSSSGIAGEMLAGEYEAFLSGKFIAFAAETDADELVHGEFAGEDGLTAPQASARVAGYLVEKWEVSQDGTVEKLPTLVVEIPHGFGSSRSATTATGALGDDIDLSQVTTVVDASVSYGKTYQYKVRTVVYIEVPGINQTDDGDVDTYRLGIFVASRGSATIEIPAVEQEPPEPPVDIEFHYDYFNHNLIMDWNFPVNPQQDIKKFQIWRRRHGDVFENNVDKAWSTRDTTSGDYNPPWEQAYPSSTSAYDQPFSLIRVHDFNNATEPLTSNEELSIPTAIIASAPNNPKTRFIDTQFTKDSNNIYTLCSVDARGLSSNFSAQYEISFDKYRNKLIIEYVSMAGAPKPYPNLYLRRVWSPALVDDNLARNEFVKSEVMLDTIKASGFKEMRLILDPDFYELTDEDGAMGAPTSSDIGFLKFSTDGTPKYKMSIINVDSARSKVVDIIITDRRTGAVTVTEAGSEASALIEELSATFTALE